MFKTSISDLKYNTTKVMVLKVHSHVHRYSLYFFIDTPGKGAGLRVAKLFASNVVGDLNFSYN